MMKNKFFYKILTIVLFGHLILFWPYPSLTRMEFPLHSSSLIKVLFSRNGNRPSIRSDRQTELTKKNITKNTVISPSQLTKNVSGGSNESSEVLGVEGLLKKLSTADKITLPEYTWQAYELRLQGKVVVKIVVGEEGKPLRVEDLSPELSELLRTIVKTTVQKWYLPSFSNRELCVAFDFRPED